VLPTFIHNKKKNWFSILEIKSRIDTIPSQKKKNKNKDNSIIIIILITIIIRVVHGQLKSSGALGTLSALNSQGSPSAKAQAKYTLALIGGKV
jgi:hypothetical protein